MLEARAELERAEKLRQARKFDKAQKICESLLKQHTDYAAALHTLGLVLADKKDYEKSLSVLVRATMLNPRDWTTLTVLSGVYVRLNAPKMAARTLEQARKLKPDDPGILATLGEIYRNETEYEAGAEAFRLALKLDPSMIQIKMQLGRCCTHLGELAEAADAFQDCLQKIPDSVGILYWLSQLPASLIDVDLLSMLEKAKPESSEKPEVLESTRAFALAGALDKAGRHKEAWENLVIANRYPAEQHASEYDKDTSFQEMFLTGLGKSPVPAKLYKPNSGANSGSGLSETPISLFILGPSRSGKTTMEHLAGSLDGVKRGYESPIIENTVQQTFRTAALPTRNWMVEVPPGLDDLCREIYSEELDQRAAGSKVFTNTHPGQIHGALRAAATLPNMRYVFMKRDFDDICFRIFTKSYATGNGYSYRMKWVQDFVTWYYNMMDLLAERMPETSIIIQYEDMINDPAAVRKKIAKLCGLAAPKGAPPKIGDDRNCAAPYKALMKAALEE